MAEIRPWGEGMGFLGRGRLIGFQSGPEIQGQRVHRISPVPSHGAVAFVRQERDQLDQRKLSDPLESTTVSSSSSSFNVGSFGY